MTVGPVPGPRVTGPPVTGDDRRPARWYVLLAFTAAVVVLSTSGGGVLGAPPPGDLSGWLERVGPVVAAVAVLRLLALAAGSWLLVASVLHAAASAVGATRLVLAAERAMPPGVRRLLTGLAGVGAASTALVGATSAPATGAGPERPPAERLVRMPPATGGEDGVHGDEAPSAPTGPTVSMSIAPAGAPPVALADEWEVAPGDSFWSIAEEVVGERLGRVPTDPEVAAYWRRLVAANADRLVGGDADLIYPGQRFLLPP